MSAEAPAARRLVGLLALVSLLLSLLLTEGIVRLFLRQVPRCADRDRRSSR